MPSNGLRNALIDRYCQGVTTVKKSFKLPLSESFQPTAVDAGIFDAGTVLDTTVTFTDICRSSLVTANMDPERVLAYFDDFYSRVIPLIYQLGGEVEKLIGDGIIAVFGPPYMETRQEGTRASVQFALDIVSKLKRTQCPVKVAVCGGPLCFARIGTAEFQEASMIGNTLTELFRLESVAENTAVNVFDGTPEALELDRRLTRRPLGTTLSPGWVSGSRDVELTGLGARTIRWEAFVSPK